MDTITACFKIIMEGDEEASRAAARQVRKLLYGSRRNDFKDIKKIIAQASERYDRIKEDWRRENFVVAFSVIYYLHDFESKPDFLFSWLFHLLQHANGNIRQAAVRMFRNEIGPLTVYIRIPGFKPGFKKELSPEQADGILYVLYSNLIELMDELHKPAYDKYKYVSSLPNGPYKSVQLVLAELKNSCGKQYMERLQDSYRKVQVVDNRKNLIKAIAEGDILVKAAFTLAQAKLKEMRKELETGMVPFVTEIFPRFDFQNVAAHAYNETLGPNELPDFFADLTDKELSLDQRNALMDLLSSIWNLYPHKNLDGYSPCEIAAMHEILNTRERKEK